MIFHSHTQGSPEWLAARAGCITASRFKDAVDALKTGKPSARATGYAALVAVERIAGVPLDLMNFQTWQMKAGQEQEPAARLAYEAETGRLVEEVGLITTEDGLFGYSPDGLVGDRGLLEIKTLLSAEQICKCIGRGDLSDYRHQCVGGLWLTGRLWIDLVLWAPALAPIDRQLTVVRIHRDEDEIEELEDRLMAFAAAVTAEENNLRGNATN